MLIKYNPRKNSRYYELKQNLLVNATDFYDGREMVVKAFKNKLFPLSDPSYCPHYTEDEKSSGSRESKESSGSEKTSGSKDSRPPTMQEKVVPGIDITEQKTNINKPYQSLVCKYFLERPLFEIMEKIKKYKEEPSDLQLYNFLIDCLDIGLKKIKDDIKNLPEDKAKEKRI